MNSKANASRPAAAPRRYSAKRTRHHVSFFCDAPGAEDARLVGDFNDWDLAATPMHRMADGRWMVNLELHHGHHRYVFVVDSTPTLDANAMGVTRIDGQPVSLIAVS